MTQLLERAFSEVAKLTKTEQDRYTQRLLEEMEADQKWEETFIRNAGAIERLAAEALAEHKAGKTLPLDLDNLVP